MRARVPSTRLLTEIEWALPRELLTVYGMRMETETEFLWVLPASARAFDYACDVGAVYGTSDGALIDVSTTDPIRTIVGAPVSQREKVPSSRWSSWGRNLCWSINGTQIFAPDPSRKYYFGVIVRALQFTHGCCAGPVLAEFISQTSTMISVPGYRAGVSQPPCRTLVCWFCCTTVTNINDNHQ
jgi:hypothetical protein